MADATVSMDAGTIVTETAVEVKTEAQAPAPQTLAEAEADYRKRFDAQHGRDIEKLFPGNKVTPINKEEPKTEIAKTEEVKTEVKTETPPEKKPKGGYARTISRLNRELGAERERNRQMDDRLKALETTKPTTQTTQVVEDPEPTRDKFATDLEYFTATRAWDKRQLTKTVDDAKKTVETSVSDIEANRKFNEFVEHKDKFEAEHPDFAEVIEKSSVEFKDVIVGMLIDNGGIDPAFLYDMALSPKEAKHLNTLSDDAISAVGSAADKPTDVMRYLSKNPDEIAKINRLDVVKMAKFVGIIETKVESAKADKTAGAKTDEKKTETGKQAEPAIEEKKVETKTSTPTAEPAKRPKSEPPPKITGGAPSVGTSWTDPKSMSLAERERLYYEDPRNRKR